MIVPDLLEQHRPRDHGAGVLHEVFEQPELAGLQDDRLAAPMHFARQSVELEVGDAIDRLSLLRGIRRASTSMRASSSENAYGFGR